MKKDKDITVVLADGEFPSHEIPLSILRDCQRVVCCDGAAKKLVDSGIRKPDVIVGDFDSFDRSMTNEYRDCIVHIPSQETNDLTKAVQFCRDNGFLNIAILGATGLREDHTLGNISLLAQYAKYAQVSMYTNYGVFDAIDCSTEFESYKGQQISIFSLTPQITISYSGLKWDINRPLSSWWEGTLNEALSGHFKVSFGEGALVIVFRVY